MDLVLSNEQQLIILKAWSENQVPPSIPDLIKLAWPTIEKPDSRSKEGRLIKELLVSKGLDLPQPSSDYKKKGIIELNEEQKEYVTNNCSSMSPVEMARELYNNPSIFPATQEVKSIAAYVKTLDPTIVYGNDIPEQDYKAPKRPEHVLARVRKYVNIAKDWDAKKLTPAQEKSCKALVHYLHDLRFKRQIDSYEKTEDKVTFEGEFVKYTYNKADLEQEEISQYISLCSFVVMEFNIKRNIEMLQTVIQNEYDENSKISGNLVDALESARQDLNNCTMRQGKLYEALTEKRSEKLSKEMKDKESLLNFFNMWKNYDSRQQMLKIRQQDKENLRKEIHEIENMDELKIRVLGLDVDSIIDG